MLKYRISCFNLYRIGLICFIFSQLVLDTNCGSRRQCYICRSRGEPGDCRDHFRFNETTAKVTSGIKIVPCPSGWCGKTIEGVRGPPDDFGTATERTCLSQAPPDLEERCAELRINNKISLLCVCRGDLCNGSTSIKYPMTSYFWIIFSISSLWTILTLI